MAYGTEQQIAGILVDGNDSLPGPSLAIIEDQLHAKGTVFYIACHWQQDNTILAPTRRPGIARAFRSADAALNAAVGIINAAGTQEQTQIRIKPHFRD